MMRRHDDGALASVIRGDGSLALAVDPPEAEGVLCRFAERDGVLNDKCGPLLESVDAGGAGAIVTGSPGQMLGAGDGGGTMEGLR